MWIIPLFYIASDKIRRGVCSKHQEALWSFLFLKGGIKCIYSMPDSGLCLKALEDADDGSCMSSRAVRQCQCSCFIRLGFLKSNIWQFGFLSIVCYQLFPIVSELRSWPTISLLFLFLLINDSWLSFMVINIYMSYCKFIIFFVPLFLVFCCFSVFLFNNLVCFQFLQVNQSQWLLVCFALVPVSFEEFSFPVLPFLASLVFQKILFY